MKRKHMQQRRGIVKRSTKVMTPVTSPPPWIGMPKAREGQGRRQVMLRDLKVFLLAGIGKVSLKESLYYVALKTNNRAMYDKYINENNRKADTWEKFQATLQSIRRTGFRIFDPFVYIAADNEIYDGHHRLVVAMLLFGSESKVIISGSRVTGFIPAR